MIQSVNIHEKMDSLCNGILTPTKYFPLRFLTNLCQRSFQISKTSSFRITIGHLKVLLLNLIWSTI